MLISTILVTLGGGGGITSIVESLRSSLGGGRFPLEVIVVENRPFRAEHGSCVPSPGDGVTEVLRNGYNAGFARAANQGAERAKGDYLFFLNPDARPVGDAAARLVDAAARLDDAGLVGARLVDRLGRDRPWGGPFHFKPARLVQRLRGRRAFPVPEGDGPFRVDWVAATAAVIRRSTFELLGGFSTSYYMYFEDVDLCARSEAEGFRSYLVPGARFEHSGAAGYRDDETRRRADYATSRAMFFRKRAPLTARMLLPFLDLALTRGYNRLE